MSKVEVGAARRYAELVFGGPVQESESNPTAQTSFTTLVKGNGDRVALVIVNMGSNDVVIGLTSGISSTNGIRLGANGGSVSMDVTRDFTLCTREWAGLAIGGTSGVYVLELSRYDVRL